MLTAGWLGSAGTEWLSGGEVLPDGSLLLAGGAAHHLIQTGDNLHDRPEEVAGPYVAILTADFSSIRFSTLLNATATAWVRDGTAWGIASRQVKGRHLALFAGSARYKVRGSDPARPAPQRRPLQRGYAGGMSDGYLVVIDLGAAK